MEKKASEYFAAAPGVNEVWSAGGKLWVSESAAINSGADDVKKHVRGAGNKKEKAEKEKEGGE